MGKSERTIQVIGQVREILPNTMFKIVFDDGNSALATPAGKLRRSFVRIMPGDRVRVEMADYDKTRGRIIQKL